MERLTYDFCVGSVHCNQVRGADNVECREVCQRQDDDGCATCPIARTFDRLAAIEDILGDEYDLDRLRELVQADQEGRCFITPFVAMVEQSLMNGEMKPERDQRFNGRYAVVYFDPEKWKVPLIDICGAPYNKEEAEQRAQQLIREAAEKALEKEENRNG